MSFYNPRSSSLYKIKTLKSAHVVAFFCDLNTFIFSHFLINVPMKNEAIKIFQKKKKNILETWIKFQLTDDTLREDLMSNEDLRSQSDELLNVLVSALSDENIDNPKSTSFEAVN